MKIVEPKVELLDIVGIDDINLLIDNNILKLYYGYRRCYSGDTDNFTLKYNRLPLTPEERIEVENFIRKMRKSPHESPLEHVTMTWHVYNMDRAISHQWVRHRIAAHSQASQRYVKYDNLEVTVPDSIKNNENMFQAYKKYMEGVEELYKGFIGNGIPAEDARSILPNATATHIVTTMNLREMIHFFNERCCYRAQKGIRDIAYEMLYICNQMYPCVFEGVGPKCLSMKRCPEAKPCEEKPFKKF